MQFPMKYCVLKTRVFKTAQKKKLPGWEGDLRQSLQDIKSCLGGEATSLYPAICEEAVRPVSSGTLHDHDLYVPTLPSMQCKVSCLK